MKKKRPAKEHKLYQTKSVLFYEESTIISQLSRLIERHELKYGVEPKKIFMSEEQWREYEIEVTSQSPQVAYNYSVMGYPKLTTSNSIKGAMTRRGVVALHFRGIPIVIDEQWKGLLYEEKTT